MWHGVYISWLEEARINALDQVGLSYSSLTAMGIELPVVQLEIQYMKSLFHGEKVHLESWALARKGVRWPWKTNFYKEDRSLAAEAIVNLVFLRIDSKGRKLMRNFPSMEVERAFNALQVGSRESFSDWN